MDQPSPESTARPAPPLTVWVDGDACHVAGEIIRVCKRYGFVPRLVSNKVLARYQHRRDVEVTVVPQDFDAADHHIVANLRPGDLALTGDILLAARALKAGAAALDFRGRWFTDDNIGDLVAKRELKRVLRDMDVITGGPSRPSSGDRALLLQELNNFLDRARRGVISRSR